MPGMRMSVTFLSSGLTRQGLLVIVNILAGGGRGKTGYPDTTLALQPVFHLPDLFQVIVKHFLRHRSCSRIFALQHFCLRQAHGHLLTPHHIADKITVNVGGMMNDHALLVRILAYLRGNMASTYK